MVSWKDLTLCTAKNNINEEQYQRGTISVRNNIKGLVLATLNRLQVNSTPRPRSSLPSALYLDAGPCDEPNCLVSTRSLLDHDLKTTKPLSHVQIAVCQYPPPCNFLSLSLSVQILALHPTFVLARTSISRFQTLSKELYQLFPNPKSLLNNGPTRLLLHRHACPARIFLHRPKGPTRLLLHRPEGPAWLFLHRHAQCVSSLFFRPSLPPQPDLLLTSCFRFDRVIAKRNGPEDVLADMPSRC